MSLKELGIEYKKVKATLVAYIQFNLKERTDIQDMLQELAGAIPEGGIAGAPYVNIQYFSSYTEGFEAETGFPVTGDVESGRVRSKISSALEVLALAYTDPPESLRETKIKLHQFSSQHALISDEFTRKVYLDWQNPNGPIEIQFVIHNWNAIFARDLERVLGKAERDTVMQGAEALHVESAPEERFQWAKAAMQRLDALADERQKYNVVSSCAHVFPPGLLEKLKQVYAETRSQTDDPFEAVDAVRAFMQADAGWGPDMPERQGHVIYHTKQPADLQAYEQAQTAEEKRAAYCFCPIIRARLDEGMPITYCYCGSGWFRQQWEAATGKPVTVDVIQSVLKGDLICQFAVHLPEDL